ncbi:hypothetical protein DCW30_05615 [Streptomyces alfalfae]|uniref:DUF2087 domain-containing protein n=1 Tax=Streptomyces alfalfae TaxID=1642299 RepID=A0ABN4VKT7_9ACTN|nr:hypothetical protein [Streptomyces alfalfae]APY88221.1 hypothetical protein A7J05_23260 [Streptomyces alfalfae]AYA18616.1 hypothetical protein D3X13_22370 [Streptomyces fradiae]RXX46504.1 hypothetical protein DCW30_05615 [Streptomyces alfalfae]RZM90017.1 hypothetical protein D4104_25550 [Streptomyces alfalfae]
MPDQMTRRAWLLIAIQGEPGPISTGRAEQLLAATGWSCHRNTARKDLRALAARGALRPVDADGRRTYTPTTIGEDGRS